MGNLKYLEIDITIEDMASILYGMEVGKSASDGSVVVLKLKHEDFRNEVNDRERSDQYKDYG